MMLVWVQVQVQQTLGQLDAGRFCFGRPVKMAGVLALLALHDNDDGWGRGWAARAPPTVLSWSCVVRHGFLVRAVCRVLSVYCVACTVCCVLCTVCHVLRTVYCVLCTVYL